VSNYIEPRPSIHARSKLNLLAFYSRTRRKSLERLTAALIGLGLVGPLHGAPSGGTAMPIQHLVIVFQENVSFDHYFGTYPIAEPTLTANPRFTQNQARQRLTVTLQPW
jgi:phospholipase C